MAKHLDPLHQAELTEFVNELARAAGYTTTADWARESGYPASNLSNLRNAKAAIDGYNLLRLINAAAARIETSPADAAVTSAQKLSDLTLASRLEEVAALAAEGLARLEAGIARVEKRLGSGDTRSRNDQ